MDPLDLYLAGQISLDRLLDEVTTSVHIGVYPRPMLMLKSTATGSRARKKKRVIEGEIGNVVTSIGPTRYTDIGRNSNTPASIRTYMDRKRKRRKDEDFDPQEFDSDLRHLTKKVRRQFTNQFSRQLNRAEAEKVIQGYETKKGRRMRPDEKSRALKVIS